MITGIVTAVSAEEQAQLQRLAEGGTVLELGSYYGASTIVMAQVARIVHAVDWHRGDESAGESDTLEEFFANLRAHGVGDKVVAHVGRFEDVVPLFRKGYFDMAFLDGAHTHTATVAQIEMATRLLDAGAVIAFHDYGSGFPGVKQAVDERFPSVEVVRTLAWAYL